MISIEHLDKRGSYIVESAIALPILIISLTLMISIIRLLTGIEESSFIMADEMKAESIRSHFIKSKATCRYNVNKRIGENCKIYSRYVFNIRNDRSTVVGLKDTFRGELNANFSAQNPLLPIKGKKIKLYVVSRRFTGASNSADPMSEAEFMRDGKSEQVYVFPHEGMRYHNGNCKFLNPACMKGILTPKLKRTLKPCKRCNAKNLRLGTPVYFFMNAGDVYHVRRCKYVKKVFKAVEKETAIKKGYKACKVCGG